MKPVIAVMPLVDDARDSYWMLPGYFDALRQAGALPFMPALTRDADEIEQIFSMCDGLLLTGGHDVHPIRYGQQPRYPDMEFSEARDEMELRLLALALAADKPVFGICRGLQIMNVFFGGTLYQDLPHEFDSDVDHHQRPPYNRTVHDVRVVQGSPLHDVLAATLGEDGVLPVNSYHHQAVRKLGEGLRPMAISEDGLVEAVYAPASTFVQAVQWHPEFLHGSDEASRRILRAFTGACS